MPFTIEIHLGAEHSITFEEWVDGVFGQYVPAGTAFARAIGPSGAGVVVTNGPRVLLSKADLRRGTSIAPGDCLAKGLAEGDEIPYGKPYCLFVPSVTV